MLEEFVQKISTVKYNYFWFWVLKIFITLTSCKWKNVKSVLVLRKKERKKVLCQSIITFKNIVSIVASGIPLPPSRCSFQ